MDFELSFCAQERNEYLEGKKEFAWPGKVQKAVYNRGISNAAW
jgi:Fe-S cluster biosynthesis and repair protein YggX